MCHTYSCRAVRDQHGLPEDACPMRNRTATVDLTDERTSLYPKFIVSELQISSISTDCQILGRQAISLPPSLVSNTNVWYHRMRIVAMLLSSVKWK